MAAEMTPAQWEARQHRLNLWVKEMKLEGVKPIVEDGRPDHATRRRIKEAHYWLGYQRLSTNWSEAFGARLIDTFNEKRTPPHMIRRGISRRRAHNRAWRRNHEQGSSAQGVGTYDGVRVARWLIPYLSWARRHGWRGRLNSGWRDPAYSERLCRQMCGRPSCPGRCAGRASNHSGSVKPYGAVDVSDYGTFARLMRQCPLEPRIFNALGARDPVHFSASGR